MGLKTSVRVLLEQAANDNGFGLLQKADDDWLIFKSQAFPVSICMKEIEGGFVVGTDHQRVAQEIDHKIYRSPSSPKGFVLHFVPNTTTVYNYADTIWRFAKSLPDQPLKEYQARLSSYDINTEIESLGKRRIGQEVFRDALFDYWNSQCAVTEVKNPKLLRASHIIPWSNCDSDSERLNVSNGLLLVAHLDAAFDTGLITFDNFGRMEFSSAISDEDRLALNLKDEMTLKRITDEHRKRLSWHRQNLFKD